MEQERVQRCSVCGKRGPTCERHLEQMRNAQKRKRNKRRDRGLCLDCRKPAEEGRSRCAYHRNLKNEKARARNRVRREEEEE